MKKNIINFSLLIVIMIIIILSGFCPIINKEGFDIGVGVDGKHLYYSGKFDDCHQIGTRYGITDSQCKRLCNKMDSCVGISYKKSPNNECALYNDTSLLKVDPGYRSWFNFWNKMY
jgi:hypothetical protein